MEMAVVTALAVLGLLVVLLALRADGELDAPAPPRPDWDPLPTRADLARTDFGLRIPGYDPATVDVAFDALADAYADLLGEADPATLARARRRAVARLAGERGERGDAAGAANAADAAGAVGMTSRGPGPGAQPPADPSAILPSAAEAPDPTAEALRAEVVLDTLRREDGRD